MLDVCYTLIMQDRDSKQRAEVDDLLYTPRTSLTREEQLRRNDLAAASLGNHP